MDIAYFVTYYPYRDLVSQPDYHLRYTHAGAEDVAYNLAVNMARRGHAIQVFTTSIDGRDAVDTRASCRTAG